MKADYGRVMKRAKRELENLLSQRERIDRRIAKLELAIRSLAALSGQNSAAHIAYSSPHQSLGLTDLIRVALKTSPEPLTPTQITAQILSWRPDFKAKQTLLISTHTILKRLIKNGEAAVVSGLGSRKSYKWVSEVSRALASLRGVEKGVGFSH